MYTEEISGLFRFPAEDFTQARQCWTDCVLANAWSALKAIAAAPRADRDGLVRLVEQAIDGWHEYLTSVTPGPVRSGQMDALRKLLRAAGGTVVPRTICDADVAARLGCLSPIPAIPGTERSLAVLFGYHGPVDPGNRCATLRVEAVDVQGADLIGLVRAPYADPERNWHMVLAPDFQSAIEDAWSSVRDALGDEVDRVCLRYRLEFRSGSEEATYRLTGVSAGVALLLCFREAARAALGEPSLLLNPSACVTARLVRTDRGLMLGAVDAIPEKIREAFEQKLDAVIVAPENFGAAYGVARDGNRRGHRLDVVQADTVERALEAAAELPEAIQVLLRRQRDELERVPFRLPNGQLLANADLFVEPGLIVSLPAGRGDRDGRDAEDQQSEGSPTHEPQALGWGDFARDVVSGQSRLAVIAPPGGGKSFVTRRLLLDATNQALADLKAGGAIAVPLWITAAELAQAALGAGGMGDALATLLRARYGGLQAAGNLAPWLQAHLDSPRTLLVVDALEEVGLDHVEQLRQRLTELGSLVQARLIVTCRQQQWETTWRDKLAWQMVATARLSEFGNDLVHAFASRFFEAAKRPDLAAGFRGELDRDERLAGLCRNPLLLSLVCRILMQNEDAHEGMAIASIYGRSMRLLLRGDGSGTMTRLGWDTEEMMNALGEAAWNLFKDNPSGNRFAKNEFVAALPQRIVIGEGARPTAAAFADALVRLGALVPTGMDGGGQPLYAFPHATMLEFMAAYNLQQMAQDTRERELASRLRLTEPGWHGLIPFLAELSPDGSWLLQLVRGHTNDEEDPFGERLLIEARILQYSRAVRWDDVGRLGEMIMGRPDHFLADLQLAAFSASGAARDWLVGQARRGVCTPILDRLVKASFVPACAWAVVAAWRSVVRVLSTTEQLIAKSRLLSALTQQEEEALAVQWWGMDSLVAYAHDVAASADPSERRSAYEFIATRVMAQADPVLRAPDAWETLLRSLPEGDRRKAMAFLIKQLGIRASQCRGTELGFLDSLVPFAREAALSADQDERCNACRFLRVRREFRVLGTRELRRLVQLAGHAGSEDWEYASKVLVDRVCDACAALSQRNEYAGMLRRIGRSVRSGDFYGRKLVTRMTPDPVFRAILAACSGDLDESACSLCAGVVLAFCFSDGGGRYFGHTEGPAMEVLDKLDECARGLGEDTGRRYATAKYCAGMSQSGPEPRHFRARFADALNRAGGGEVDAWQVLEEMVPAFPRSSAELMGDTSTFLDEVGLPASDDLAQMLRQAQFLAQAYAATGMVGSHMALSRLLQRGGPELLVPLLNSPWPDGSTDNISFIIFESAGQAGLWPAIGRLEIGDPQMCYTLARCVTAAVYGTSGSGAESWLGEFLVRTAAANPDTGLWAALGDFPRYTEHDQGSLSQEGRRWRAFGAAGDCAPVLRAMARDGDLGSRITAVRVAACLEPTPAWDVLAELAEDESPNVRYAVAEACGVVGQVVPEARAILTELAYDVHVKVRLHVAGACAVLPLDDSLFPILLRLTEVRPELRGADPLLDSTHPLPNAKVAVVTTAALIGGDPAVTVLSRLAEDPDSVVLRTVALGAGQLAASGAVNVLERVLATPPAGLEEQSATLQELGPRSRLEGLRRYAGQVLAWYRIGGWSWERCCGADISYENGLPSSVRSEAFESLVCLGDVPEVRALLARLAEADDPLMQDMALEAASRLDSPKTQRARLMEVLRAGRPGAARILNTKITEALQSGDQDKLAAITQAIGCAHFAEGLDALVRIARANLGQDQGPVPDALFGALLELRYADPREIWWAASDKIAEIIVSVVRCNPARYWGSGMASELWIDAGYGDGRGHRIWDLNTVIPEIMRVAQEEDGVNLPPYRPDFTVRPSRDVARELRDECQRWLSSRADAIAAGTATPDEKEWYCRVLANPICPLLPPDISQWERYLDALEKAGGSRQALLRIQGEARSRGGEPAAIGRAVTRLGVPRGCCGSRGAR